MSVEGWARRASGLLVPRLGFANLAGQMQPCPDGECCGSGITLPCYTGDIPLSIWIDLPALGNGTCQDCADYAGTYQATWDTIGGYWLALPTNHCGFNNAVLIHLIEVGGQCSIVVEFFIAGAFSSVVWSLVVGVISAFDHVVPFSTDDSQVCLGTGTTVYVYE